MDTSKTETADGTDMYGDKSTKLQTLDWQNINVKEEVGEMNTDVIKQSTSHEKSEIFYACIVCNLVFLEVAIVLEHIMKAHRGGVLCLKCKYLMDSNPQLKEHEKSCNNERPFFIEFIKCKICFGLCQQSETNDQGVCDNCVSLETVQNDDRNPIASLDNSSPVQDTDEVQTNELIDPDNTNNEYIDINTFLNFKSKNGSNMNDNADSNVSESNALYKTINFVTKTEDDETSVPTTVISQPNNVYSSCDKPSNSLINTSVSDQVSTVCCNQTCACLSFDNGNFGKHVGRLLCNMLNKLLVISGGGFLKSFDYCIFCLVCKKDLIFFYYFTEHILKYQKCKCYSCPLCGDTNIYLSLFDFANHFDQHLNTTLKNNAVYCSICKVSFLNEFNFQRHCELYHCPLSIPPVVKLCDGELQKVEAMKKFCTKQYFMDKFKIHCTSCKKDYSKEYYFDYHILTCSKNEIYMCSLCYQQNHLTRSSFLMEMWLHCLAIETKNCSICDICNINFPNSDNLLMHQANKHECEKIESSCSRTSQSDAEITSQDQLSAEVNSDILRQRAMDIINQKNKMAVKDGKNGAWESLVEVFTIEISKDKELDAKDERSVFNSSLSDSNNSNVKSDKKEVIILDLEENSSVTQNSCITKGASLSESYKKITLKQFKFEKIGKDELKEAVIPPHIIRQTEYMFKYYKKKNTKYKKKKCAIFCIACKNDILFKDYIRNHFISCFEINGGKCPLCCKESEDEQCNVLDHLMHVWNIHLVSKCQIKPKLCHKCDIMLTNSYNFVMHNAYKHSSKLETTTSSSKKTAPFEFCVVKSEPCDNENKSPPQKMTRLG